jgi:hypothetical protein
MQWASKPHTNSTSWPEMQHDQITIEWIGGAWDGATLLTDLQAATGLLGKVCDCPSRGAPFMILSDVAPEGEPRVRYQADTGISVGDILVLRPTVLTKKTNARPRRLRLQ